MTSRRAFVQSIGAGACLGLPPVARSAAAVTPDIVRFRPEIEPLVKLFEETPREKCVDLLVEQLRRGTSYRQLLAALFLAGIRNVNPAPPGFALHCVFVIHSVHQMVLDAPASDRLLPLFYALDQFKRSQDQDARQKTGDYVMRPLRGALPPPERAAAELAAAMETWDKERAERAMVSLARHRGATDLIESLWRYGARDYRNIGHKAIYVACARRTLETIGWQHAEPVLRSVAVALLDFGREQQVNGYAFDDQCFHANVKRAKDGIARLKPDWTEPRADPAATREMLDAIRAATVEEACAHAAGQLVAGKASAAAMWDAVHLAAGEMMMLKPRNIVAIHAVTSANALRHAYIASAEPATRFLLLLQAVGWMAQFRRLLSGRENNLPDLKITDLAAAEKPVDLAETLAEVSARPIDAARQVLALARDRAATEAFTAAVARLIFAKADEAHYYKYAAAVLEDFRLVSPEWQPHMLSTAVYYLKGPGDPAPAVLQRAREALRSLDRAG